MIEYEKDTNIEQFEYIAEKVRTLSQIPSNEELLTLYALYKQATIGNNRTPQPSIFNQKDRFKWDAWTKQSGKGKNNARKEYIKFATKLIEKYPPKI